MARSKKNLEKEKVVYSYSINALSCLVNHSLSNTFAKPNLLEVCMKVVEFFTRICQFLAHISRLLPNQINVKFDQDIKDSASGGDLKRFIGCPSVDNVASKFSQPNMRAIF